MMPLDLAPRRHHQNVNVALGPRARLVAVRVGPVRRVQRHHAIFRRDAVQHGNVLVMADEAVDRPGIHDGKDAVDECVGAGAGRDDQRVALREFRQRRAAQQPHPLHLEGDVDDARLARTDVGLEDDAAPDVRVVDRRHEFLPVDACPIQRGNALGNARFDIANRRGLAQQPGDRAQVADRADDGLRLGAVLPAARATPCSGRPGRARWADSAASPRSRSGGGATARSSGMV